MHKKVSTLAAALLKADRDIPKLDVAAFDDESTRPVPLSLIRLFAEQPDLTVSLKIAIPDDETATHMQIDTGDAEDKKKNSQ
ncbi:MAG TPA: hypothetical protein VF376_10655 [Thermoanaerobaculia bacterium]